MPKGRRDINKIIVYFVTQWMILIDLMIDNESPSDISDRIKDMLYAKSAEKVEAEKDQTCLLVYLAMSQMK